LAAARDECRSEQKRHYNMGCFHSHILVVFVMATDKSSDFDLQVEHVFRRIEDCFDALDVGIETIRRGPVLEVEFEDGKKIVINSQAPMKEIWMAAKVGAFHFRSVDGKWLDTRTSEEFFAMLSRIASQLSGQAIIVA
jgi:CyaY protein